MLRFGKLAPILDPKTPKFSAYMAPTLPPPPPAFSVLALVAANLRRNDTANLFPMDGNDAVGDCTIAGLAHAQTLWRGLTKALCIWGEGDILNFYYAMTGGQDSGLACLSVLQEWHRRPINHDRILGYAAVDPKNHQHVMQALHLFGGLYLGFTVTGDCIRQFENGMPWTPGTLTDEGHCVVADGYDAQGLDLLTWGSRQRGTWAWWDQGVDECYAVVPPEAANPNFAPGYNVATLVRDLEAVT